MRLIFAMVIFANLLFAVGAQAFPSDGPNLMNLEYRWVYQGVDRNGCRSCAHYDSGFQCNARSVGALMKAAVPGTKNDDYKYECVRRVVSADRPTFPQYPANGPQHFSSQIFQWVYMGIDRNGCGRCEKSFPGMICSESTYNALVKSRVPGTRNDDYKFQCDYTND